MNSCPTSPYSSRSLDPQNADFLVTSALPNFPLLPFFRSLKMLLQRRMARDHLLEGGSYVFAVGIWALLYFIVPTISLRSEIIEGNLSVSATELSISNTRDPHGISCSAEAAGVFVLPPIDPEKFEILSYLVEWVPFALCAAWDSDLGNNSVAIGMTGGFPGNSGPKLFVDERRNTTDRAHSISLSSISFFSANKDQFPEGYFYSNQSGGNRFNFSLSALGVGLHYNTPDNHGAFALVNWGKMKVSYRLLRLDPSAPAPTSLPSSAVTEVESRTLDSDPLVRPPASVFDQIGFVPASLSGIPSSTVFSGPKSFRTKLYGFTGYTYKLMVGESIGVGVAVDEMEGTNSLLAFDYTFTGAGSRGFAWIEEVKTPEVPTE